MTSATPKICTVLGERYAKRFWSNVAKTSTCWVWLGPKDVNGYGRFYMGTVPHQANLLAHRVSYEMAYGGKIAEAQALDHLCRTPSCVNPDHLEPVSIGENAMRGQSVCAQYARQEACTICAASLAGENLYITPKGYRQCRACIRRREQGKRVRLCKSISAYKRAWRARRKEAGLAYV